MSSIHIIEAAENDAKIVAVLIAELLTELEPEAEKDIKQMGLAQIAASLLAQEKIWVLLAKQDEQCIGVVTLHECAAIYAGGVFGEISELYVKPKYRSAKVGEQLILAAKQKAKARHWKRLEVGTPPAEGHARTVRFYEAQGFMATGIRMRCLIDPS